MPLDGVANWDLEDGRNGALLHQEGLTSGLLIPTSSTGLQEEAEVPFYHSAAFSPGSPKLFQAASIHSKLVSSLEQLVCIGTLGTKLFPRQGHWGNPMVAGCTGFTDPLTHELAGRVVATDNGEQVCAPSRTGNKMPDSSYNPSSSAPS